MTEMNATMMENATAAMTETSNEVQTTQYEMTEQLAGKMHITLAEARAALEAADWNMLTATHMLEQEEFLRKQALYEAAESCAASDAATQDAAAPGKAVYTTAEARGTLKKAAARPRKNRRWFSNLCDHLRRMVAFGNRNRFTVFKGNDPLLEMPVTALALLLLFSFGTCALLMAVGLFAGCRYTVTATAEA